MAYHLLGSYIPQCTCYNHVLHVPFPSYTMFLFDLYFYILLHVTNLALYFVLNTAIRTLDSSVFGIVILTTCISVYKRKGYTISILIVIILL